MLLILPIVTFLYGKNYTSSGLASKEETNKSTPAITTYKHQEEKFAFKYQSNYKIVLEENMVKVDNGKAFILNVRIHQNGSQQYLEKIWKKYNCITCDYDVAPNPYKNQEVKEINGNKVFFNTDSSNTQHAFIANPNHTKIIEFSTYGPNYTEKFNDIISSFSFTN